MPDVVEEKQCRICLDGSEAENELGRLIRPCLCKGSISVRQRLSFHLQGFHLISSQYVHVRCLQRWRTTSASNSAFFACPQCHYHYHFARTSVFGIATNPGLYPVPSMNHIFLMTATVVVGTVSAMLFTSLVMMSSFLTTFFVTSADEPSYYWYSFYVSPIEVVGDLVRASFRIFQDEGGILEDILLSKLFPTESARRRPASLSDSKPPGVVKRFIRRFLLGLPVVGAGSLVHMLLSLPFIGPVHWLARYRGSRNRRGNSRDLAAIVIVGLIIIGALRRVTYLL